MRIYIYLMKSYNLLTKLCKIKNKSSSLSSYVPDVIHFASVYHTKKFDTSCILRQTGPPHRVGCLAPL